jgi:hypothetical protein
LEVSFFECDGDQTPHPRGDVPAQGDEVSDAGMVRRRTRSVDLRRFAIPVGRAI